jgi:restriction system protein
MSIPTINQILIPLLRIVSDEEIHILKECVIKVSDHFKLSNAEKNALQPSGVQTKLEKRVSWAKMYLHKMGFVETIEKGKFRITKEGLLYLDSGETQIKITRKMIVK